MKRSIWSEIKESFKNNKVPTLIMVILIVATYVGMMALAERGRKDIEEISYNQFWEYVNDGKVDTIYYNQSSEYMTITLLNADTKDMTREQRNKYDYSDAYKRRVLYPGTDCNFRERILMADTNIRVIQSSWVGDIGRLVVTIVLYMSIFIIMMKLISAPIIATKEKDLIQTSDVTFDDIIGHEEIIDDVRFITNLIKDPQLGDSVGAKLPKGLLLEGPPGTGKTLIAKAIAHEAGVPFLYQNASGFIEMYVGLGARRVRSLFKIAKKNAPCIIFIDEIDAIGGKRGESKGTSENEQTINALLQEMDGFKGRDGIFIIAATNRADSLDDALVRSGRFDRRITVNPPRDWTVRKRLFEHYLKNFKVADDIDLDGLSKQVSGFTGADVAMVCNEASIVAIMHKKDVIDTDCIEEAIDKKMFNGNRSKSGGYEVDRNIVAYHEAGHAVMTYLVGQPIAVASIQPTTSGVGGYVKSEDNTETIFQTADDLKNSVLIAYAGRASEEIKFGKITTGSSNDITQGSRILSAYIEKLGFDHEFGLLDISVLAQNHLVNSDKIVERLAAMSRESYAECKSRLEENYHLVEKLAAALLEKSKLSGSEIKRLLES
jgi:cell division protease FtsH